MNKVTKAISAVGYGAMTYLFVAANNVFAQWVVPGDLGLASGDLWDIVLNALRWVIGLIALVAVVMLIWNGVQYITAGGDEGKVEKATKGITNAIIGLVICFLAGIIVSFVIQQLNTLNK